MEAYIGGSWRTLSSAEAYINGRWRALRYAEAYISGQWRTIATFTTPTTPHSGGGGGGGTGGGGGGGGGTTTFTLTASPSSVSGEANTNRVTSGSITATPSGGVSPYTYSWSAVTEVGGSLGFTAASLATTAVSIFSTDPATVSGTVHCVCTDAAGKTATSNAVSVTLIRD